jgi:hypothetical protein
MLRKRAEAEKAKQAAAEQAVEEEGRSRKRQASSK